MNKLQELHYLLLTKYPEITTSIQESIWSHHEWGLSISHDEEQFHISWNKENDQLSVHNVTNNTDGLYFVIFTLIDGIKYRHAD